MRKATIFHPTLVNIIFLAPGGWRLERGITQGEFCAPHRTPVKILCKQLETLSTIKFVDGAVINYIKDEKFRRKKFRGTFPNFGGKIFGGINFSEYFRRNFSQPKYLGLLPFRAFQRSNSWKKYFWKIIFGHVLLKMHSQC